MENTNQPVEKKRRGRKKKWDITNTTDYTKSPFDNNPTVKFETSENKSEGKNISFGNVKIVIQQNETVCKNLDTYVFENLASDKKASIFLSKSEIDEYKENNENIIYTDSNKTLKINKNNRICILKHYTDAQSQGKEIPDSNGIYCYHCVHPFEGKPFFLPYDYSPELNRYKLFGNFCSPNCAKAYGLKSMIFNKKIHLVSRFYREYLKGYLIKPAPNPHLLKCFGGPMDITKYRETFDNKSEFITKNLMASISYIEISQI